MKHQTEGILIDATTTTPGWRGERFDLWIAIDWFLGARRRIAAEPVAEPGAEPDRPAGC